MKQKKYRKVRDQRHYTREYKGATNNICILKYSVLEKFLIAFQNGSNYDNLFIIKVLAEEFEK